MAMEIAVYDPVSHYQAVMELWKQTLGLSYPVTDRVARPRLWTRPSLEPGDGVVALEGGRVVGVAVAEISRDALTPQSGGSIELVMVCPSHQRRGVGRRLVSAIEERMRSAGCIESHVARGLYRFWSGTPLDLAGASEFFEACGYTNTGEVIDMVAPLRDFRADPDREKTARGMGVSIAPVKAEELGRAYELLTREAPGWREAFLKMAASGDLGNVLAVRRGRDFIGCVQTFTPESRFRYANLAWEGLYGPALGGLGAVLIAKAWRGRGLGLYMIEQSAAHVKSRGGSHVYIDWTSDGLAGFYAKIGAVVCRRFRKHMKKLS